jgi:para-nitrobenzyl esterase
MPRDFRCNAETVAKTADGALRGFYLDGLYIFQGIKYADAKRFHAPEPVKPWEGVREATNYGYICPVPNEPMPMGELLIPHRFWPSNEHCQYLNIWTPALEGGAKKPVIVWLHGGGYSSGSSIEQVAYEGDALAKYADAVVITLNHRLNILGFLDMSSFGPEYANSVNAGMADIVEALRWVKRNISAFGGDPENVTLIGQSGGGGKISTLLQTPAAAGLFHKAVLMSGIFEGFEGEPVDHRDFILDTMALLNIPADAPEKLEKVPYDVLMRAFNKAALKKLREAKKLINWGPVANDWYLGDPMQVGFTDYAKTVPTIAGTVIAEFTGFAPAPETNDPQGKLELLRKSYGDDAEKLVRLFRAAYPDKDEMTLLKLDVGARRATTRYIEEKARVSSAPAYLYLFALDFEVDGPRPAWHCSDIPFVFHNADRVPCANIQGVTEQLEQEVAGSLAAFARTGDPNHSGMVNWPAYEDGSKATMIFDRTTRAGSNYDRELIEDLHALAPGGDMLGMAARMLEAAEREEGGEWIY